MDMHTRRLVVWDLGAIASSGRCDARELICKIMLATASISGMAPTIPIDVEINGVCRREYHVDGGGVAQIFVKFGPNHPLPDPANPGKPWLAGSNLYAIAGGKTYVDHLEPLLGFVGRVKTTVSATLYALFRADLWRLYSLCHASGMKYHYTAVPDDENAGLGSTSFDPAVQRKLFTAGYDFAMKKTEWRHTPPGYEPGEEEAPRAGLSFMLPGNPK
jgi:hypothetical protein